MSSDGEFDLPCYLDLVYPFVIAIFPLCFIWNHGVDIDHDSTNILPPRTTGNLSIICIYTFAQNLRLVCFYFTISADVQRLDLQDCNLYGVSPSNPGPMVLCDQCNHVIAPEGIMRHVKRVHGSKIVPAPSNKLRIPSKGSSTAGSTQSNANTQYISRITNNSLSTPQAADATLSTEFTNRLNVSKMAPPTPLNAAAGKTADGRFAFIYQYIFLLLFDHSQ